MKNYKLVIQARMGSRRLPGKMLLPVNGKPLLLFLIDRLLKEHEKKSIIVATSNKIIDDQIHLLCKKNNIYCYRGSEKNVYSRYKEISELDRNVKHLIRLTGDNPLINLKLITDVFEDHLKNNSFFTSTREINDNNITRYSPKGQSVDIINTDAFKFVKEDELTEFEKEHVIPVFYKKLNYYIHKPRNYNELLPISIDRYSDFKKLKKYNNY